MATVGGLIVNLALNTIGLTAGLAKAKAEMSSFQAAVTTGSASAAGGFPLITAAAGLAALGVIGVGIASVKAASQFEYEMKLIRVQAGATAGELKTMSEALLGLAPGVMTGPAELARGLFHIESVGIRGAAALDLLKTSAQGAIVGNANLESVTNALVATVLSGVKGVDDFSGAMGTLNGIVGTGNLRMEDLAKSLSSGILSTARTFGLSIQDIGAALATMADQGIPAEEAATRLRITIALLGAPTKIAAHELSRIGLTSRDIADEMRGPNGLIGAMKMLKDHMDRAGLDATEQSQLLKNAFGGSRSSAGILVLINSLGLMDQKMAVIRAKSGSFQEDFRQASETASAHFKKLQAVVEVLAVRIGNGLLPVIIPVVSVLAEIGQHTEIIVPLFMILTALITFMATKALVLLAVSVARTTIQILAFAAANFLAATGMRVVGATAPQLTLGLAGVGPAAATGAAGVTIFGVAVGALLLPITLFVAAAILLVTHFNEVRQGLLVLRYDFLGGVQGILEAASKLPFVGDSFKGLAQGLSDERVRLVDEMRKLDHEMSLSKGDSFESAMDAVTKEIQSGTGPVVDATQTLVQLFGETIGGVEAAATDAAASAMDAMAKEIRAGQAAPAEAFGTLVEMLKTQMTPAMEIAQAVGILSSSELAQGLASGDASVVAAAEALRKHAIERLDAITDGAYSAGINSAVAYADGFAKAQAILNIGKSLGLDTSGLQASLDALRAKADSDANTFNDKFAPSVDAANAALERLRETQAKAAGLSSVRADMTSAFAEIKAAANSFFDSLHNRNLQAIHDAHDLKNAILDQKEANIQRPIDAAQSALDFRRRQIEEWRLRRAVTEAQDPAARRDAILALEDFLAQSHINEMQSEADAEKKALEAKKKANDDVERQQVAAENKRYENQKRDFARQLAALERFLKAHPEKWREAQNEVLALLAGYGIDFRTVGAALGSDFADGLASQVAAVVAAAAALGAAAGAAASAGAAAAAGSATAGAAAGLGAIAGAAAAAAAAAAGGGNYRPPGYASGNWRVMKDNMLAMLHKDEMVVPAYAADVLRAIGGDTSRYRTIGSRWQSPGVHSSAGDSHGGGGKLVVMVGSEKLVDITDRGLYVQETVYGGTHRPSLGSMR